MLPLLLFLLPIPPPSLASMSGPTSTSGLEELEVRLSVTGLVLLYTQVWGGGGNTTSGKHTRPQQTFELSKVAIFGLL